MGLNNGRLELAESRQQLSGFSVDRNRVVASEGSERSRCELEQGSYPGLTNAKIGPCPIEERPFPRAWKRFVSRR